MKRFFAGLLFCAVAASGQENGYRQVNDFPFPTPSTTSKAGPECTGGLRLDDGSLEDGYREPFQSSVHFVQAFTPSTYPALLTRVCSGFRAGLSAQSGAPFTFVVYDDNGSNGTPGTELTAIPSTVSIAAPFALGWTGVDCATANVIVPSGNVYVGVRWNAGAQVSLFLGADESPATPKATMYESLTGTSWVSVGGNFPEARALGVRAEFTEAADPAPPAGPWMTSPDMPDFRFKVRLTTSGVSRLGVQESDCIFQTVCASGAIPGRPEVLLRVIGPRSNGYMWPIVIRFTNAQVESWIEQLSTGEINYYNLDFIGPDSDELTGVNDRFGFLP